MFNIGTWDWVIIFALVMIFFGSRRLPELAKGLGKSITSFKQGLKEVESEVEKSVTKDK